jgi:small subunit ribosomal protein S20
LPFSFFYLNIVFVGFSTNYSLLFMAITQSAKKALRVSLRRRIFNLRRKGQMVDAAKKIQKLVAAKDIGGAQKLLPLAYQAFDKAAKEHTIHRNRAARAKSRLAKLVAPKS